MKFSVKDIETLFQQALLKADAKYNHAGLKILEKSLEPHAKDGIYLTQKYMYESIMGGIAKAKEKAKQDVGLNADYVNILANFLGHSSFQAFCNSRKEKVQLENVLLLPATLPKQGIWFTPYLGTLKQNSQDLLFQSQAFTTSLTILSVQAHSS